MYNVLHLFDVLGGVLARRWDGRLRVDRLVTNGADLIVLKMVLVKFDPPFQRLSFGNAELSKRITLKKARIKMSTWTCFSFSPRTSWVKWSLKQPVTYALAASFPAKWWYVFPYVLHFSPSSFCCDEGNGKARTTP
jgi:hypothetical protein